MPGLYGFTGNANVSVGNTTGLYQLNSNVAVLTNAQTLLNLLSNNGTVNFSLDPTTANTRVEGNVVDSGVTAGSYGTATTIPAFTVGADGRITGVVDLPIDPSIGNYSNANVASFLTIYGGPISATAIDAPNISELNLASTNYVQMQYDPTGVYDPGNIENGSWAYVANGGFVFQSNVTGTWKSVTLSDLGEILAEGNISAPYFIGDGSKLTNLNIPSGNITLTGNVTGTGTTGSPINTTIAASGVTPGVYGSDTTIPTIVVGLDGRVTQVTTNAISGGGSYGNANVAAYLPTYTGSLDNSSSVVNLYANAASQQTQINTNTSNISTLFANAASQQGQIDNLTSNAASQQSSINTLFANAASQQSQIDSNTGNISTLFANAASQQTQIDSDTSNISTLFANAASQATDINSLWSNAAVQHGEIVTVQNNLTAFETYANLNFGTSSYANANVAAYLTTASINTTGNISANKFTSSYFDASNSAGGTLRNASGTPQLQWGSGGGNNVTLDVSTNMNGTNAQIDISPTGTGHVQIKPTGSGSVEIAPTNPGTLDNLVIGSVTPLAGTFTTLQTSGNITANTGGYFVGDGSKLTNLPAQTASGPAGGDLTGTYPNPTLTTSGATAGTYGDATTVPQVTVDAKGRVTSISNVAISGAGYGNTQVAAYLPTYTGSLENSSSVVNLWANAAAQATALAGKVSTTGQAAMTGTYEIISLIDTDDTIISAGNVSVINGTNIARTGAVIIDASGINLSGTMGDIVSTNGNFTANTMTASGNLLVGSYIGPGGHPTYTESVPGRLTVYNDSLSGPIGNVTATQGSVYATNGYFWSNGAPYTTGAAPDGASANQVVYKNGSNVAIGTSNLTFNGSLLTTPIFVSSNSSGDEGGEVQLALAQTNTTLNTSVTMDIYQNKLRFFETGGTARGAYIDLSTAGAGVSTNLLSPTFSGNLAGVALFDSVNQRILANAFPQTALTSTQTGTQQSYATTTPVYTSGNLTAPASGLNQAIGQVVSGNVNLLTQWGTGNRTSSMFSSYAQINATSANLAMNTSDRIRATASTLDLNLNGKNWGTLTSNMTSLLPIVASGNQMNTMGAGQIGHAIAVNGTVSVVPQSGAINVQYATANYGSITHTTTGSGATASNIAYARLFAGAVGGQSGNITVVNAVGLHTFSGWVSSNVSLVSNAYTVLNEDTRSVISTVGNIVINNTATTGFMKFGVFTVAQLTAIVGVAGYTAAVSNGTGKNNGALAYWDVTNTRWSWVGDDTAVS